MNLRKTCYPAVPRQVECAGATTLRLPWLALWDHFETRHVLAEVVRELHRGPAVQNRRDVLERFRLGGDALRLREWFGDLQAPTTRLNWTADGLSRLAAEIEDLARDDGAWREAACDLDVPMRESVAALRRRIPKLTCSVARRYGIEPAQQLLESLRRLFLKVHQKADPLPDWTPRQSDDLLQLAQQARTLARPRGLFPRTLVRLQPQASAKRWLSESQSNTIERRIYPAYQRAAQVRYDHEKRKRQQEVVQAVLGGPTGGTGIIDQTLAGLERRRSFFAELAGQVGGEPGLQPSAEPDEILLVRSLDTVIDPASKRTVLDLFEEAVRAAGYSPQELADKVRRKGVRVGRRRYQAAELTGLPPAEIREALSRLCSRYLGSHDRDAVLDVAQPRSAFEYAARIDLLHPELRGLLQGVLFDLKRQSLPYAEFHELNGVERNRHAFLFCYPPHRPAWEKLLAPHVTLVKCASGSEAEAYGAGHPFAVMLSQYDLGRPLGALKSLPHWVHRGNLLRKEGKHPPQWDRTHQLEQRLLAERPDEFDDSVALFEGGVKAQAILLLGGSGRPAADDVPDHAIRGIPAPAANAAARYVLARPDPRVDALFRPTTHQPLWQTAEFYLRLLKQDDFVRFVERTFSQAPGLRTALTTLAHEPPDRAGEAAEQLARLDVLERGAAGHYRMRGQPGAGNIPPGLFEARQGRLTGLSRDDFIAELHRNDLLYNLVFWQVCDALDFTQVSPRDLPPFLVSFQAGL